MQAYGTVRDPASENKIESDGGTYLRLTSGIHVHMCTTPTHVEEWKLSHKI